jgi:hypothetical protein
MKRFFFLVIAAAAASCFSAAPSRVQAQVSVGVNIGPPPVCPYGYYDYAPYPCAPYGYYGPEWFSGGVFIGAGPWFHGPADFHGHVNNRFDPHHGYKGPIPDRGAKPEPSRQPGHVANFKGNEVRDGRGHTVKGR